MPKTMPSKVVSSALGQALRDRCRALNLTQLEAAARIGVGHRTLKRWIAGGAEPRDDRQVALVARFLKCSPARVRLLAAYSALPDQHTADGALERLEVLHEAVEGLRSQLASITRELQDAIERGAMGRVQELPKAPRKVARR